MSVTAEDLQREESLQELAIRSRVQEILKPYLPVINGTPELLSLLYDGDMLPEQTVTIQGAIRLAVVIEAFYLGQQMPLHSVGEKL